MNQSIQIILGVLCVLAFIFALPAARASASRFWKATRYFIHVLHLAGIALANDNPLTVGEHEEGRLTGYVDSAPTTVRFMLMKQALTGDNHYTICTSIADMPMGVCYDEPAANTDPVSIRLFNSAGQTLKMVAAAAIPAGSLVVTNGDGYVKALPAAAGVYWGVGVAVTTANALGDLVEIDPSRDQIGVSFVT